MESGDGHSANEWGGFLPDQAAFASAYPCLPPSSVYDDGGDITWQMQPSMFGTYWAERGDPPDLLHGEVEYPAGPQEPLIVTTAVGEPVDQLHERPKRNSPRKLTKKSSVTKGTLSHKQCFR
jgi:hypothetical protein